METWRTGSTGRPTAGSLQSLASTTFGERSSGRSLTRRPRGPLSPFDAVAHLLTSSVVFEGLAFVGQSHAFASVGSSGTSAKQSLRTSATCEGSNTDSRNGLTAAPRTADVEPRKQRAEPREPVRLVLKKMKKTAVVLNALVLYRFSSPDASRFVSRALVPSAARHFRVITISAASDEPGTIDYWLNAFYLADWLADIVISVTVSRETLSHNIVTEQLSLLAGARGHNNKTTLTRMFGLEPGEDSEFGTCTA